MNTTIQITVRLFAVLRSREGVATLQLDLPSDATLATLLHRFFADRPTLSPLQPHLRFARNGDLIARGVDPAQIRLASGDEIALLPPASGGSGGETAAGRPRSPLNTALVAVVGGRRIARIDPAPLEEDLGERLGALVASDSDGAVVTFVGRTRATPGTPAPGEEEVAARVAGERVVALEYEAAPQLAERVLQEICDRLLREGAGAIGGIGVIHAVGEVPLGATSLVAVVAAPHRAAAYAASGRLIEELKREVPIWKLERFASGEVWSANPDALKS